MTPFEIISVILSFAALGAYCNHRFARLPDTIGNMVFALLASLLAIALGRLGWNGLHSATAFVRQIDFSALLLHGMLCFLLFAGALHIRFHELRDVKWIVGTLATAGVAIAMLTTGSLAWLAAILTGHRLPFIYALLFGALISPTDPIAVLAILRQTEISKKLYTKIGAESLLNDGVGVVAFLAVLAVAQSSKPMGAPEISIMLVRTALGGLALGAALGWAGYRLLRTADEYKVEVLLTLALAAGGYALAEALGVSAPLCVVAAGLVVGNRGWSPERDRIRLNLFWELMDDILNAVLFMLLGLEIVVIPMNAGHVALGILAIGATLAGRLASVALLVGILSLKTHFDRGTIPLLTWGGLRGGLSIAMALSLPVGPEKEVILPVTYIVVLFSILVQGLTFGKLARAIAAQDIRR